MPGCALDEIKIRNGICTAHPATDRQPSGTREPRIVTGRLLPDAREKSLATQP